MIAQGIELRGADFQLAKTADFELAIDTVPDFALLVSIATTGVQCCPSLYFKLRRKISWVREQGNVGVKVLAPSESCIDGRRFHFSPTQNAIMALVGQGLTDKQIAIRLGVSEHTVRSHLDRLFKSQGVHSRAAALMNWVAASKR